MTNQIDILVKAKDQSGAVLDAVKKKSDDLGTSMTRVGVAGLAATGAAAAGLISFAKQAAAAEKETLKLDNTLANAPQLAGASRDAFIDLGTAIQKKTAADGDAVVGAEALLGQFGLTQAQILRLTPLVVDLSRKLGIDLDSAAKMVGKSVEGSSTALGKAGIMVDATAAKTDAYGATVDALSKTVGGFATQEGATLEGRLASLQNRFGDIEEGVGSGVIDAFETLEPTLSRTVDTIGALNSVTDGGVGKVAAFATAGLGAVSVFNLVGGQIIKAVDLYGRYTKTTEAATAATDALAASQVAATGATTGLAASIGMSAVKAVGVSAAIYYVGKELDDLLPKSAGAQQQFEALAATDVGHLAEEFRRVSASLDKYDTMSTKVFKDLFAFDPALARSVVEALDDAGMHAGKFQKILDEANTEAWAQGYRDMATAYRTADADAAALAATQHVLTAATLMSVDAARAYAGAFDDGSAAVSGAEDAGYRTEKAFDSLNDTLAGTTAGGGAAAKAVDLVAEKAKAVKETARGAEDALWGFTDSAHALRDASASLTDAQDKLTAALKGPSATDRTKSANDLKDAQLSLKGAVFGVQDAQEKLNDAIADGDPKAEAREQLAFQEAMQRRKKAQQEVSQAQKDYNEISSWTAANDPKVADAQDAVTAAQERLARQTHDTANSWGALQDAGQKADDTIAASVESFGESNSAQAGHRANLFATRDAWYEVRDAVRANISEILSEQVTMATTVKQLDDLRDYVAHKPGLTDAQRTALLDDIARAKHTRTGVPTGGLPFASDFPGYDMGGVVPGPRGAPQLAVVHGGEEVLTPDQRSSGRGGVTVIQNFYGNAYGANDVEFMRLVGRAVEGASHLDGGLEILLQNAS